jgi:hypothetical protein
MGQEDARKEGTHGGEKGKTWGKRREGGREGGREEGLRCAYLSSATCSIRWA